MFFLCQCDPTKSFEDNLCIDQVGDDYENIIIDYKEIENFVKKIVIPMDLKNDAVISLNGMSINKETMLLGNNKFEEMHKMIENIEKQAYERRRGLLKYIKRKKGDYTKHKKI